MEDKRIIRTKHNLKDAMIRMLSIEDFEHISVTELCKEAKVSRITFYSHYSDKQSLLDDIFNDMRSIGREIITDGRRRIIRRGNLYSGM